MRDRIEAVRAYNSLVGGQYSILGWVEGPAAEATDLRRMDNFFMDLMDDESYATALMDLCVAVALDFGRAQIEAGADTIGIGDAAASQISRDLYEELVLPRQQRLVQGLKEAGGKVRMHICGNITHLLPGLASLDLDIIDVYHMVDLAVVREKLGERTVIAGNLDPVAGVLRSSPEEIRRAVRECHAKAGPRYLVAAGCENPQPHS